MNSTSRFKSQRQSRGAGKIRLFFIAGVLLLAGLGWLGLHSFTKAASEIGFLQGASSANLAESLQKQRELQEQLRQIRPTTKSDAEDLSLSAKSGISVFMDGNRAKVLFSQSADRQLPIASLTKLMTAFVTLKHYDPDQIVSVSEKAVAEEGESGFLRPGDHFTVRQLLYPLLLESSNDAAAALAQVVGRNEFVTLMNQEARGLGLRETSFVNPTGLDPDEGEALNLSSARDVATLAQHIFTSYPEAFSILGLETYETFDAQGRFHHTASSTNKLLGHEEWPTEVLGGKTGWTKKADGCLFLALKGPKELGVIFNVVLGTGDRFGETARLADWVYSSHLW